LFIMFRFSNFLTKPSLYGHALVILRLFLKYPEFDQNRYR